MHTCTEIPTLEGPQDTNCLTTLKSNYAVIHRIGNKETASTSLVFKLARNTQNVAVKVIPLKEDEQSLHDIKIACMLNGLSSMTPVFVLTFGWIKCDTIPNLWMTHVDVETDAPEVFRGAKSYVFQIMDFTSHTWTDAQIHMDLDEYRVMLFLLLHALWVARERFGVKHN